MLILGIDPGIERLGWGIIEDQNNKFKAIAYDCIFTDKNLSTSDRLAIIFEELNSLIKKYHPEEVAMEDLFFGNNSKTAIVVGQARGVIMLSLQQNRIPLTSYTPLQIKMSITGYGRADKTQIGLMVKNILKIPAVPKPDDTADALAAALTHALTGKFKKLTQK